MTGSSRETLAMEMNQSAASVSFGKRNGCYVNRSVAVILGLLFVSATVATGLLVYYYAPQVREAGDPLNLARTSVSAAWADASRFSLVLQVVFEGERSSLLKGCVGD